MIAPGEPSGFLATSPIGPTERRIAVAWVVFFLVAFTATAPFARVPLGRVHAFIPSYQSALAINDLITAILLFSQFAALKRFGLLVLASGYLFSSAISLAHLLTFPGVFAPSGLFDAGPQTTAWLYMFWHAVFPLSIAAYAWLERRTDVRAPWHVSTAIAIVVGTGAVGVAVVALTLLATVGHAALPAIMQADSYTPAMTGVVFVVWMLPLVALGALAVKRPRSLLDLWLGVVMCAWLLDMALSAVLNAGRYDLGFYAGRIYGLTAASFVLAMFLVETTALYTRLARSFETERSEHARRLREVENELIHVSRVNELGHIASGLAHEVNQPLTAAGNYVAAGLRMADAGDVAKLPGVLEKIGAQVTRASAIVERVRQFARKRETERRSEALIGVIEEAAALALAGTGGRPATLEIRLHAERAAALVDRIQVQQVLLNLIRNAVEAMQGSPRRSITIASAPAGNGMIEISVADTGPGLAPEIRERLFQPFTTTKADGMGIGLSICRAIIEAHGGRMWVEDNPGGGTVFRFTLSADAAGSGAADWRLDEARAHQHRERGGPAAA